MSSKHSLLKLLKIIIIGEWKWEKNEEKKKNEIAIKCIQKWLKCYWKFAAISNFQKYHFQSFWFTINKKKIIQRTFSYETNDIFIF